MLEKKTPYEWCLDGNMRLLELPEGNENIYMLVDLSKEEFLVYIKDTKVKTNSTPRKPEKFLEYRMYGLVPYNISSIQSGIQYGHAVVEYGQNCRGMGKLEDTYNKWASKDKTFIILNGGTTNENKDSKWYGTMQQNRDLLETTGVMFAEFREPDLNDTLTGIVFLVDERVFNRELYPDYVDMPLPWKDKRRGYKPSESELEKYETENAKNREKWVDKIGGPKNDFLRLWLRGFKLAN